MTLHLKHGVLQTVSDSWKFRFYQIIFMESKLLILPRNAEIPALSETLNNLSLILHGDTKNSYRVLVDIGL